MRGGDLTGGVTAAESESVQQAEEAAAVVPQSVLFGDVSLLTSHPALSVSSFFLRPAGDRAEEEDR